MTGHVATTGIGRPSAWSGALRRRVFWSGYFLSAMGSGIALPYLAVFLRIALRLGSLQTVAVLGLLAGANAASASLTGRRIDRQGLATLTQGAAVLQLCGYVLLAGSAASADRRMVAIGLALAGALVAGTGNGAFGACAPVIIAGLGSDDERPRLFATTYTLFNLGLGLGAVAGAALASGEHARDFRTLFLVNAVSYLCLGIVARLTVRDRERASRPAGHAPAALRSDVRLRLILVLTCLVFVFGYSTLEYGMPLLIRTKLDHGLGLVGVFVACNTMAVVLLQQPLARITARWPRTLALLCLPGAWLLAEVVGLVGASSSVAAVAIAAVAVLFSVGECFFNPTLPVLVTRIAPEGRLGGYSGAFATTISTSTFLGSVVVVLLVDRLSASGFWLSLLVATIAMVLLAVALRQRGDVEATA